MYLIIIIIQGQLFFLFFFFSVFAESDDLSFNVSATMILRSFVERRVSFVFILSSLIKIIVIKLQTSNKRQNKHLNIV